MTPEAMGDTGTLFPWSRNGRNSFGTKNTNIGLEIKGPGFKAQLSYILVAVWPWESTKSIKNCYEDQMIYWKALLYHKVLCKDWVGWATLWPWMWAAKGQRLCSHHSGQETWVATSIGFNQKICPFLGTNGLGISFTCPWLEVLFLRPF